MQLLRKSRLKIGFFSHLHLVRGLEAFLDSTEATWPYTIVGYSQTPRKKPKILHRNAAKCYSTVDDLPGCQPFIDSPWSLYHPILWGKCWKLTSEVLLRMITSLQVDCAFAFLLTLHCRAMAKGVAFSEPYLIMCLRDTTDSSAASNQRPKATISAQNMILIQLE